MRVVPSKLVFRRFITSYDGVGAERLRACMYFTGYQGSGCGALRVGYGICNTDP